MVELLSFEEIQTRYAGEWVLIAYSDVDHNLRPVAGEVIAHSQSRDDVYEAIAKGKGRNLAIECFAKTPEDMVLIL